MLAAMVLGAEAVQIGSRFVASEEASCHSNFKNAVIEATEGDTMLSMKQLVPVRLIKNNFFEDIKAAEGKGASAEELKIILGRGRAKKGMFEGDMEQGELEIGQSSILIDNIFPAAKIIKTICTEFKEALADTNKKIYF